MGRVVSRPPGPGPTQSTPRPQIKMAIHRRSCFATTHTPGGSRRLHPPVSLRRWRARLASLFDERVRSVPTGWDSCTKYIPFRAVSDTLHVGGILQDPQIHATRSTRPRVPGPIDTVNWLTPLMLPLPDRGKDSVTQRSADPLSPARSALRRHAPLWRGLLRSMTLRIAVKDAQNSSEGRSG